LSSDEQNRAVDSVRLAGAGISERLLGKIIYLALLDHFTDFFCSVLFYFMDVKKIDDLQDTKVTLQLYHI
jgi:hypothetical protein